MLACVLYFALRFKRFCAGGQTLKLLRVHQSVTLRAG
jgi:hypothetical protein